MSELTNSLNVELSRKTGAWPEKEARTPLPALRALHELSVRLDEAMRLIADMESNIDELETSYEARIKALEDKAKSAKKVKA